MKNLLLISLMALAFVLGACGQKSPGGTTYKATRSQGPTAANAPYVSSNANSNPGAWGQITNYQRSNVVDFLSSGLSANQIGFVNNTDTPNCQTLNGQPCQIDFNISMNPDGGNFAPLTLIPGTQSQYTVDPSQGGILTIAVYDSFTGNGTSAIAAPAQIQSAQVNYSGSTGVAILTFANDIGTITLQPANNSQGDIQGQTFAGIITFSYNGGQETLGQFNTNICYIFQCNGN